MRLFPACSRPLRVQTQQFVKNILLRTNPKGCCVFTQYHHSSLCGDGITYWRFNRPGVNARRAIKNSLYSWSVEAVDWAVSLLGPDATEQLRALLDPNIHQRRVTLEKSCSTVGGVVFVPCKLRTLEALTRRFKHIVYRHLCVCARVIGWHSPRIMAVCLVQSHL